MKKYMPFLLILCFLVFTGCSVKKTNTEKIRDIEFTVVEEESIPTELKSEIEEKKTEPFRMTYTDGGYLYIAKGYGTRETSGYSVEADECYETANAIYIHTNLLGPSNEEKTVEAKTYPYVVVKMENIDKNVVFK